MRVTQTGVAGLIAFAIALVSTPSSANDSVVPAATGSTPTKIGGGYWGAVYEGGSSLTYKGYQDLNFGVLYKPWYSDYSWYDTGLLPVVESSTPETCSVSQLPEPTYSGTHRVQALKSGRCTLRATFDGDSQYAAAPALETSTIIATTTASLTVKYSEEDWVIGQSETLTYSYSLPYNYYETDLSQAAPLLTTQTPDVCAVNGLSLSAVGQGACQFSVQSAAVGRVLWGSDYDGTPKHALFGSTAQVIQGGFRVWDPNAVPERVAAIQTDGSCGYEGVRLKWDYVAPTPLGWMKKGYRWQILVRNKLVKPATRTFLDVSVNKHSTSMSARACLSRGQSTQYLWGRSHIRLRGVSSDGRTTPWSEEISPKPVYRYTAPATRVKMFAGAGALITTWRDPTRLYGAPIRKTEVAWQMRAPRGTDVPPTRSNCDTKANRCVLSIPRGYKLRARVRISNGHGWSYWENSKWHRF